jgi:hypothetical protein
MEESDICISDDCPLWRKGSAEGAKEYSFIFSSSNSDSRTPFVIKKL